MPGARTSAAPRFLAAPLDITVLRGCTRPGPGHGKRGPSSPLAGPPHHGDRAVRVVQHGLADRSQEQPGETTPPPGADDQKLRGAACFDQCLTGAAAQHSALDQDTRVPLLMARECLGQEALLSR